MNADLQVAVAAAEAGGAVLRDRFGHRLAVAYKGEVDLVTDADRAAESAVLDVIRRARPGDDILAEEGGGSQRGCDRLWVVDPLDGTTNFAHGFPWFAVSVALAVAGRVTVGVILQPLSGELFTAVRGGGARLNGHPLHVSATSGLERAFLATGFPYDRRRSEVDNLDHYARFQKAAFACRRAGAACLDLAYVAAGRFDGFWEMKLKPWDMAAGRLLVEEAGGRVSDFDGREIGLESAEILATNDRLYEPMVALLQQGRRP